MFGQHLNREIPVYLDRFGHRTGRLRFCGFDFISNNTLYISLSPPPTIAGFVGFIHLCAALDLEFCGFQLLGFCIVCQNHFRRFGQFGDWCILGFVSPGFANLTPVCRAETIFSSQFNHVLAYGGVVHGVYGLYWPGLGLPETNATAVLFDFWWCREALILSTCGLG